MELKRPYTLECCVDSVESALCAEAGGATRLELCSSLVTGGLSPSLALFREVRRRCGLRIHVLLRPRFGDFLYTESEFAVLLEEVAMFRDAGAEGVVIGCLTPDGRLDLPKLEALIACAGNLWVTLHRAFDVCVDPLEALEQAKQLGCNAILTSGAENNCLEGKKLLGQLIRRAGNKLEIMAGAGVNAAAIQELLRETGGRSFHMSGKAVLESGMVYRNPRVSMGLPSLSEYAIWRTDAKAVRAAAEVLEHWNFV